MRRQARVAFVGREREVAEARDLLSSTRLLTVVGPGGVGKTRLAQEVMAKARLGAVRYIALDALSQGELTEQVVASALGAVGHTGQQTLEMLIETIGNRRLLIVLDNCEHLLADTGRIAGYLVTQCPRVSVLATSRQALGVPGETVLHLGPLGFPPAGQAPTLAEVMSFDAVKLFLAAACAHNPGFVGLTRKDASIVAAICERLDGLPLALELAAQWVGHLGLEEILAGLAHQPTRLGGDAAQPSRHASLRSVIGWSYRLLEATEQAVFRRVSILYGDFSLEQAAAVCGMDRPTVSAHLQALARKSLVVALGIRGGDRWYRMLNTNRVYGCERLETSGDLGATRDRALRWLADLAERALALFLPEETAARLLTGGQNLIAAVGYTSAADDSRHVLLTLALARYWRLMEQPAAARGLLDRLLERGPDSAYYVHTLAWASSVATNHGDYREAVHLARRATARARHDHDLDALTIALNALGIAAAGVGDAAGALAAFEQAAVILHGLGRRLDAARIEHHVAWTLLTAGWVTEAFRVMSGSAAVIREMASPEGHSERMHTLGAILLARGDLDTAAATFADGLGHAPRDTLTGVHLVEGLAIVAAHRDDSQRALRLSAAATAMSRRVGAQPDPWWQTRVAAARTQAVQRIGAEAAADAAREGERMRGHPLRAYALETLTTPTPAQRST